MIVGILVYSFTKSKQNCEVVIVKLNKEAVFDTS